VSRHPIAAALLAAWVTSAAAQAPMPGARVFGEPDAAGVAALIARGEQALQVGDAAASIAAFEQASMLRHASDIELGWLHAQMQAGAYRRALAFAAHLAGAHRDAATGAALYAWLLHLGGQPVAALAQVQSAALRWPGDASIEWVRARLEGRGGIEAGTLRIGPSATGARVPAEAVAAGSGVLVGPARAVVPLSAVDGASAIWLRDGMGRTRRAEVEAEDGPVRIAVLRLDGSIDTTLPAAAPSAYPGSPAFAIGYLTATGKPNWPTMTAGFLGAVGIGSIDRPLGFAMPGLSVGGPVFDHHARLAGISVPGQGGAVNFVPWSRLAPWVDPVDTPAPAPRATPDAIYEAALPVSVTVLVLR
jgi:hypothetical protein